MVESKISPTGDSGPEFIIYRYLLVVLVLERPKEQDETKGEDGQEQQLLDLEAALFPVVDEDLSVVDPLHGEDEVPDQLGVVVVV
jgi:hypothetical protein